jgi:hypothetical protein
MMANKFILTLAVPMVLLCLASSASADPFLSATGPPDIAGTASSTFEGDLTDLTGMLILDDMIVTGLENLDGTTENYVTGSDNILGTDVYLKADFEDGKLTDSDNLLKIYDGSDVFFEAKLHNASLDLFTLNGSFRMLFTTGHTKGASTLAEDESDWIDDFHPALSDSGMAFFFTAHVSKQDDRNEELYHLNNASGKMTPTPEPGTIVLFGAALAGGLLVRHRRKRA